jgi:thermostable 8-oxoguanine DNA glycosylase
MVSNHIVKFLVDREQLARLKANASAKGYKTLSAYLRNLALDRDIAFEKMIIEIHREVVENGRTQT